MARTRVDLLCWAAMLVVLAGAHVCRAQEDGGSAAAAADAAETAAADAATASKALQGELESVRAQLSSSMEENMRLKLVEGQLSTLQPAHEALQAELSASKVAEVEAQAKLRTLGVSHTELQGLYETADASNKALQARVTDLEGQVAAERNAAVEEVAELRKRVAELEEAWLPTWLEDAVEDVREKSQTAIDVTSQKSRELYAQGAAMGKEYYSKACESTIVSDMQTHTAHYRQVGLEKAKEGVAYAQEAWKTTEAKLEPLMAEASSHATQIHMELTQFVQHKMSDNATLRPYSDHSTVSMLVTAMMVSPFIALATPVFLWLLSCCCKRAPKATRPSSTPRATAAKGGAATKPASGSDSGSMKKKKVNDPKSPVQYGQVGEVSVGGERVKYGKPMRM